MKEYFPILIRKGDEPAHQKGRDGKNEYERENTTPRFARKNKFHIVEAETGKHNQVYIRKRNNYHSFSPSDRAQVEWLMGMNGSRGNRGKNQKSLK